MTVQIDVLGRFRITPSARLSRKGQGLIAYLAIEGPTDRGKLADMFWEQSWEEARHSLRNALLALRHAIPDNIRADFRALWLENFACDWHALVRYAADPGKILPDFCRGPFLDNLTTIASEPWEDWHRLRTAESENRLTTGLMRQIEGGGEEAIAAGEFLMRVDPTHEEAAGLLMRRYIRAGKRVRALSVYRTHADALQRELSVRPSRQLDQLREALAVGR